MVILQVVYKSLLRRKNKALLALLAMSFSICFVLMLTHLKVEFTHTLARVTERADLIVGAPAQPIHLALYALFRIGNPPPAISDDYLQKLQAHPEIKTAIPLSLQESHQGHTVTGTDERLFQSINPDPTRVFAKGEGFSKPFSVVLGATLAASLGYLPGEMMTIAAGDEPSLYDEYPQLFTITGILAPTGSALDNSIIVPLKTLKTVRNQQKTDHINLILIKLHSNQAILSMQNHIKNRFNRSVEVVIPQQELAFVQQAGNRLLNILLGVLAVTALMALVMVFFSVSNSLAERRCEVQALQMLGARAHQVIVIGLLEPFVIILLASICGFLLFIVTIYALEMFAPTHWAPWLGKQEVSFTEITTLLLLFALGSLLTSIPAWRAYGQCLQR